MIWNKNHFFLSYGKVQKSLNSTCKYICLHGIIILSRRLWFMLVNRKFRVYPSVKQKELINKTIGCSRLVYNIMLSKKKDNSKLTSFDKENI